jgi:hypothetical protein
VYLSVRSLLFLLCPLLSALFYKIYILYLLYLFTKREIRRISAIFCVNRGCKQVVNCVNKPEVTS